MSNYNEFSQCYNYIMNDVDYSVIGDFIDAAIKKYFPVKTGIVCDLACGTGRLANILCEKGYDMIAVDKSPEMLDIARNNTENKKILYLNQDITELDMFGTVEVFVSTMDSINHLESIEAVTKCFEKVSLFLEKDGLFIFDINSDKKFTQVLKDNTFVYDYENVFCVWENFYDNKEKVNYADLTFFIKSGDKYIRNAETIEEVNYSLEEILETLHNCGMKEIEIFDGFSFEKYNKNSDRITIIARRNNG